MVPWDLEGSTETLGLANDEAKPMPMRLFNDDDDHVNFMDMRNGRIALAFDRDRIELRDWRRHERLASVAATDSTHMAININQSSGNVFVGGDRYKNVIKLWKADSGKEEGAELMQKITSTHSCRLMEIFDLTAKYLIIEAIDGYLDHCIIVYKMDEATSECRELHVLSPHNDIKCAIILRSKPDGIMVTGHSRDAGSLLEKFGRGVPEPESMSEVSFRIKQCGFLHFTSLYV